MICEGCKRELPANAKFCPSCGKAVAAPKSAPGGMKCPQCGALYPEGAKFCRGDGKPLQPADSAAPAPAAAPATAVAPPVPAPPSPPAAAPPGQAPPAAPPKPTPLAPAATPPKPPVPASAAKTAVPGGPTVVEARKTPLAAYGAALVVILAVAATAWFLWSRFAPTRVTRQAQVAITEGVEDAPAPPAGEEPAPAEEPSGAASPSGSAGVGAPAPALPEQRAQAAPEHPPAARTGSPGVTAAVTEAQTPRPIPPCPEEICVEVYDPLCTPERAGIGALVRCTAYYSLVQTRDKEPIEIEESAHLDGARKAAATQRVQRSSGRNRLEISFTVPKLKAGRHTVTLKARRRGVTGSADTSLTVQ